jgi:glycosyltransferase involved in cell wall biosynthesis
MKIGIIADELAMVSVASVFQQLERTLTAQHHEVVRRPLDYYYTSGSKQEALCKNFLLNCDMVIGRIDDKVLRAREALDRKPPMIGFLMGSMSRGAAEMALWSRYLKSTDMLVGNCDGDVGITEKFFKNACIRKIPFAYDDSTFYPVDEQREQAIRAELGFQPDDRILLYSGRITIEKNLHTLFRIFSVLQDLVPNIHLVVVGEPYNIPFSALGMYPVSVSGTLMRLMDDLQLNKSQVHLIGRKGAAQLRDLYAISDLLVNLTLHHDENFGFAQVEAMACGTPVIGTSWGGLKDVIKHGETGYQIGTVVTDSGVKLNWWEAINRIVFLLENEDVMQRLRDRCCSYAKEISSPAVFGQMLESLVNDCSKENRNGNGSGPLSTSDFADEFWLKCLPNEFSPPSFHRGPRSFEMYKEMIVPYTGLTENLIPDSEELKPDQLLVLAVPVRVEANTLKPDDPIFPLEFEIPEAHQDECKAMLEVMRNEPVIEVKRLDKLIAARAENRFQTTLKWMLYKGILLRTKRMDAYLDPDMIGAIMGKPVFSIHSVDFATDVIVIK